MFSSLMNMIKTLFISVLMIVFVFGVSALLIYGGYIYFSGVENVFDIGWLFLGLISGGFAMIYAIKPFHFEEKKIS